MTGTEQPDHILLPSTEIEGYVSITTEIICCAIYHLIEFLSGVQVDRSCTHQFQHRCNVEGN